MKNSVVARDCSNEYKYIYSIIIYIYMLLKYYFYLKCFVNIQAESNWVTEEEDEDDGEKESHHGGVSPAVGWDTVVDGCGSRRVS